MKFRCILILIMITHFCSTYIYAGNALLFEYTKINAKASPLDNTFSFKFPFKCLQHISFVGITASCHCVHVFPINKSYNKNEADIISGNINIMGLTGQPSYFIQVQTSCGELHTLQVSIDIQKILRVHPRILVWTSKSIDSKSITIELNPKYAKSIKHIQCNKHITSNIQSLQQYLYKVTFVPNKQFTNLNEIAIIEVETIDNQVRKFFVNLLIK